MPNKLKKSAYHQLAKKRGMRWLGNESPGVDTPTPWLCSNGHRWEATYSNVKQGVNCLHCSHKDPKVAADYEELARKKDVEWLGPMPQNVTVKTSWRCSCGNTWRACYQSVVANGKDCPRCGHKRASDKLRKGKTDYQAIGEKKGLRWLGREVTTGCRIKTLWECDQGHKILKSYAQVRNAKEYGCDKCRRKAWGLSIRGENHPNWKGGPTQYPPEWTRKLKASTRERDENRCGICGIEWKAGEGLFHVHHINFNSYDCKDENLITLCEPCHKWTMANREDAIRELTWLMAERIQHDTHKVGLYDFHSFEYAGTPIANRSSTTSD